MSTDVEPAGGTAPPTNQVAEERLSLDRLVEAPGTRRRRWQRLDRVPLYPARYLEHGTVCSSFYCDFYWLLKISVQAKFCQVFYLSFSTRPAWMARSGHRTSLPTVTFKMRVYQTWTLWNVFAILLLYYEKQFCASGVCGVYRLTWRAAVPEMARGFSSMLHAILFPKLSL